MKQLVQEHAFVAVYRKFAFLIGVYPCRIANDIIDCWSLKHTSFKCIWINNFYVLTSLLNFLMYARKEYVRKLN